jgi:hypothetical protein
MKSRFAPAGILYLGTLVLTLNLTGQTPSAAADWEDERLSRVFSPTDSKECLFTIDDKHAIKATYYRGELGEVRVVPKYFFHDTHHEWTEPDSPVVMVPEAYRSLLNRIQSAKPLGKLLKEGQTGVTLNLRTSFQDLYERGLVERAMFRVSPEKDYDVAFFRVVYFRSVFGKIESMEGPSTLVPDQGYRVKLGSKWYWTTEHSFKQMVLGQEGTVQAAGPVSE